MAETARPAGMLAASLFAAIAACRAGQVGGPERAILALRHRKGKLQGRLIFQSTFLRPRSPLMHGQFIWYELTTPDIDAAKTFYPRFTGWGTQPFDSNYTMWTSCGVPIGGLVQLTDELRQQGVPPNWMPYVETANVDDTVAKATSLGGVVRYGPDDIPGTGRIAVLQDPQGAAFGIYTPSNPGGAWDGNPVVGRFSWHELMTTDAAAAFEFYRALFGWDKNGEMDMGGGAMYTMYGHGQTMYGGMFDRTPDMAGMHPFWLVYIHVKDVGKAVATATKAGATIHRPQMDIPGGSIAILGDPQGAGFALHHANAPVSEATGGVKPAAKRVAKAAKRVAKNVAKAAKTLTTQVATAARKAEKKVAKKAKTVMKRGTKAAKTSARKAAKPAKAATRPKAKTKAKKKAKARKSMPNARKKRTAARSRARRR